MQILEYIKYIKTQRNPASDKPVYSCLLVISQMYLITETLSFLKHKVGKTYFGIYGERN